MLSAAGRSERLLLTTIRSRGVALIVKVVRIPAYKSERETTMQAVFPTTKLWMRFAGDSLAGSEIRRTATRSSYAIYQYDGGRYQARQRCSRRSDRRRERVRRISCAGIRVEGQ